MEYKGMKKNSGIIPLPPETQGLITELATAVAHAWDMGYLIATDPAVSAERSRLRQAMAGAGDLLFELKRILIGFDNGVFAVSADAPADLEAAIDHMRHAVTLASAARTGVCLPLHAAH